LFNPNPIPNPVPDPKPYRNVIINMKEPQQHDSQNQIIKSSH